MQCSYVLVLQYETTRWVKKTWPFPSEHNFGKHSQILIILSLLQTEINCNQMYPDIYHSIPNLLVHYVQVKWQIQLHVCGQIISVCDSERIIEIGQYLRKLCLNDKWSSFFTHSIESRESLVIIWCPPQQCLYNGLAHPVDYSIFAQEWIHPSEGSMDSAGLQPSWLEPLLSIACWGIKQSCNFVFNHLL